MPQGIHCVCNKLSPVHVSGDDEFELRKAALDWKHLGAGTVGTVSGS